MGRRRLPPTHLSVPTGRGWGVPDRRHAHSPLETRGWVCTCSWRQSWLAAEPEQAHTRGVSALQASLRLLPILSRHCWAGKRKLSKTRTPSTGASLRTGEAAQRPGAWTAAGSRRGGGCPPVLAGAEEGQGCPRRVAARRASWRRPPVSTAGERQESRPSGRSVDVGSSLQSHTFPQQHLRRSRQVRGQSHVGAALALPSAQSPPPRFRRGEETEADLQASRG